MKYRMMIGNGRNVTMGMGKCCIQFINERSKEVYKFILWSCKRKKRNVECLHIEGAKQSPEKRIRGFLSEYFFMAVLILAAPPTGSCFSADSTL